jgi:hypothetical protein
MAFDQAAIGALYAQIVSAAEKLAGFETVIQHEPKAAPVSVPALAVWFSGFGPARGMSGLAATSARVEFKARAYLNAMSKPEGTTDPKLIALASQLIGAFSAGFTLGGNVMAVDLLGAWGNPLQAAAGYVSHDGHEFRVAELVIPVVIDDIWTQGA